MTPTVAQCRDELWGPVVPCPWGLCGTRRKTHRVRSFAYFLHRCYQAIDEALANTAIPGGWRLPAHRPREFHRERVPHPAWAYVRDRILERDHDLCKVCGRGSDLQVDHIIPAADGGSDHPLNLQLLCLACHHRKSAADEARWAVERREAVVVEWKRTHPPLEDFTNA